MCLDKVVKFISLPVIMRRQRSSVGMRMLWAGVTNASATGSGSPEDSFTGVFSGSGVGSAEDDILLSLKLLRHYVSLPSVGIFRGLMAPCVAEIDLISWTKRVLKLPINTKNKIFLILVHLVCFKIFNNKLYMAVTICTWVFESVDKWRIPITPLTPR